MKKLNKYLYVIIIFLGISSIADENNVTAAKKLEENGEYFLASLMLKENLRPYAPEAFQLLFDFNEKMINTLTPKSTRDTALIFIPPKKDNVVASKSKWLVTGATAVVLTVCFPVPAVGAFMASNNLQKEVAEASHRQKIAVKHMTTPLITADEATAVMNSYDIAKGNVIYMEAILQNQIKTAPEQIDELIVKWNRLKQQKERLKKERTKYLSFMVISPYLWEASRQIFLSGRNWRVLSGKDKDILKSAVLFLAKSCTTEWLYQSDESVRLQFVDVQKSLKEIVPT